MMVELRYVSITLGAQCVMMDGISEMQKLCVDNLVMMEVNFVACTLH